MDQLLALLSSFGPYGAAAGTILYIVYRIILARRPDLIPIPAPSAPKSDAERFPILSKIFPKMFGIPTVGDAPPEAIDAIRVELDELTAMLHDDLKGQLETIAKLVKPVPMKLQ